jgi:putative ABC transport system permease protein
MWWSFWRTPARMAWRDLRASRARAAFIAGAMCVSIASVTAVSHSAAVARQTLGRDARVWLAGDVALETSEPISDDQIAALNQMRHEGIEWTLVTWVLTMASSDQSPDRVYLGIKAIDPRVYPFYGAPLLRPPQRLADALSIDTIVVSENALERLHVRVGDLMRIGGRPFRIAAVIAAEPERPHGTVGWGPRGILSREAFDQIAFSSGGNAVTNRIVVRLPAGYDRKKWLDRLQTLAPEARAFDYREAAMPEVARVELVISFLTVIAFMVLVLGAIGVAAAVRLNLEQRMDTLAIMRITGAQTAQMTSLFLFESGALLAGSLVIGLPLGWGISAALLALASNYIVLSGSSIWASTPILPSLIAALAMMTPLLVGPLNAAWVLKPLEMLRRNVHESRPPLRRMRALLAGAAAFALISAALIAYRMIQAWKPAVFLSAAIAISTALAWAMGAIVLRAVRVSMTKWRCAPTLKHAFTGLYRHGNQSLIVIVCLAIGVMSITGTFVISGAVVQTASNALPYPKANLLIANFEESHGERVRQFLESQPGVESVELVTQVWLRLARVDGQPIDAATFMAKCSNHPSEAQGPRVTVANDLASRFGARAGSSLVFETRDATIPATVGAIRYPGADERFWLNILVDCRELPPSSLIAVAAVRVQDDRLATVQKAVNTELPTLAAITSNDIRSTIEGVTADALRLVRLASWIAAVAGLLILVAIVATSRAARSREMAILAALGANRATIFKIYSLEFAATGAISALIGSVLASGFSGVLLAVLFYRPQIVIDWPATAGAIAVLSVLTVGAGWLPLYRLLDQRPLEGLRHE